jgi:hypothetical protein
VSDSRPPRSRLLWPAVVLGWIIIGAGLRGLWVNRNLTRPFPWAVLFGGGLIVHDLVVAPLVVAGGWAISRLTPKAVRALLQGALIASAIITLYAWPLVRGYGRNPTNPTILPRNYAHGLLICLAIVWLAAGSLGILRWKRSGRTRMGDRRGH